MQRRLLALCLLIGQRPDVVVPANPMGGADLVLDAALGRLGGWPLGSRRIAGAARVPGLAPRLSTPPFTVVD